MTHVRRDRREPVLDPMPRAPAGAGTLPDDVHRRRRACALALRVMVGLGVVVFLIREGGRSGTMLRLDALALTGCLVAVGMMALALFVSAFRWKLVLGASGARLLTLWRFYLIGWFFSLFLPTSVGGDAVRAVAVGRSSTGGAAFSSIVVERLLGVAALGFYLMLGLVLATTASARAVVRLPVRIAPVRLWPMALGLVAVALVAAIAVRWVPRARVFAREALGLWRQLRRSRSRLGAALLASLLVQALYVLVWYELAIAFRLAVPLLAFLVFVPLVSLAAMIPLTVAGLGLREGAWALLLPPLGIPVAEAVRFSLAYYGCSLLLGAFGGLLFTLSGLRVNLQMASHGPDNDRLPLEFAAHAGDR